MKDIKPVITSALASLLAFGVIANASAAPTKHMNEEKCAGIVKAGQNDCTTSANACRSHVTVDNHPEAWVWVPKGTCGKIVGGRIVAVLAPDEQ